MRKTSVKNATVKQTRSRKKKEPLGASIVAAILKNRIHKRIRAPKNDDHQKQVERLLQRLSHTLICDPHNLVRYVDDSLFITLYCWQRLEGSGIHLCELTDEQLSYSYNEIKKIAEESTLKDLFKRIDLFIQSPVFDLITETELDV